MVTRRTACSTRRQVRMASRRRECSRGRADAKLRSSGLLVLRKLRITAWTAFGKLAGLLIGIFCRRKIDARKSPVLVHPRGIEVSFGHAVHSAAFNFWLCMRP